MGIRFLISFLFVLLHLTPAFCAGNSCLTCHSPHYEQQGQCGVCHKGNPDTERIAIAHHALISAKFAFFKIEGSPVVERGQQLLKGSGCRRCHVSAGKGGHLAADLDQAPTVFQPEELFQAIHLPAFFMPNFHFKDEQITELVNTILAGADKAEEPAGEVPLVIHFESQQNLELNLFVKYCGPCHKQLTTKYGGLGEGEIGPNLSGLFGEFHSQNFAEGKAWTVENLEKWLKNPLQFRKNARMVPLRLKNDEFKELVKIWLDELPGEDNLSKE